MKTLFLILSLLSFPLYAAKISNTSELSLVKSGGNTDLTVFNAKTENKTQLGAHELKLSGGYTVGENSGVVDARHWNVHLQDSYSITAHWGLFLGEKVEGNRFKGYEKRFNTDIGYFYKLYETDHVKSKVEAGYRYVAEEKVTGAYSHDHQIRLFGDLDQKINESVKWKFEIEYLKDIEIGDAWELNFGPSLIVTMSSIFSLKVGYEAEYRNLPATVGARKYDYVTTTGLIASF